MIWYQRSILSDISKKRLSICKLNDENAFLKSKLLSLEKFISKVIDNNSVINSSISGSEISISNDPVSIVNDQPTDSKTIQPRPVNLLFMKNL